MLGSQKVLLRKVGSTVKQFYLTWDLENNVNHVDADSIFGLGRYKVEFWLYDRELDEVAGLIDYVYVDYSDWDCPLNDNDVFIYYYSSTDIRFRWFGGNSIGIQISNSNVNRELKIWYQILEISPTISVRSKTQNKGNFKTTTETHGLSYLNFPTKSTSYTGFLGHIDYGSLFLNLSVSSGHHAYISENETMNIENGAKFIVSDNAILTFQPNSTLYIKNGGKFCNNGTVNGNVNIIYERRGISNSCSPSHSPFIGGNITIEDSAIVEFPDSTTLVFDSTAVFTMMPYSELRMGEHSKIIFQNGSRINCNNSKITSLDSTEV